MMIKRILPLLLCLVFLFSLLAGCGQQTVPAASTSPSAQATAEAVTTNASTPAPVQGEPVSLVLCKPIWGDKTADDPSVKLIQAEILKKLNIDLTIVGQQNPADQEEKPKLMLASGEQLDMFNMGDWTKYMKNDTIIPLNDLLDQYGKDIVANAHPDSFRLRTSKDGKIWAIPYEQFPVSVCVLMRQDWLDELGLKVPTTIAEYETVIQAFKEKKNDQGFVPLWAGVTETAFLGSFVKTADKNWLDTDGKIKPPFMAAGYKDYLAKMQEWLKKGYLHKELATMQYQQAVDTFNAGGSGVMMNWLNSIEGNEASLKAKQPDGKLVGVPPLKGTEKGMYSSDLPYGWGTVITKSCKNPEAAMKLMNYTSGTDEGYLLTVFGVEGTQWEWVDKEKGIAKELGDPKSELYLFAGGETSLTTGFLTKFFSKYAVSQKDKDFMGWLNDPTKVNTAFPVDFGVIYDVEQMASKDKFAGLDTFITEAKWNVILGTKPADSWDATVQEWMDKGGTGWIDDYTAQYNAAKK